MTPCMAEMTNYEKIMNAGGFRRGWCCSCVGGAEVAGKFDRLDYDLCVPACTCLCLSYNDASEQVELVLTKICELIEQYEFIDEENARVRFLEFGEYAQELELYVYIKTNDFSEYLERREAINLRIIDIVGSAGAHLTVPVKNISVTQSSEPASA